MTRTGSSPDGEPFDEARFEHAQLSVGFAARQWDLIWTHPDSDGELWLGGHDCLPFGGTCQPGSRFNLVVSLFRRYGQEPAPHVRHLGHMMVDGPLDGTSHEPLDHLAAEVASAVVAGKRVLVRCHAGLNRSALVVGLALSRLGVPPPESVPMMRAARDKNVLFNAAFLAHLHARHETYLQRP